MHWGLTTNLLLRVSLFFSFISYFPFEFFPSIPFHTCLSFFIMFSPLFLRLHDVQTGNIENQKESKNHMDTESIQDGDDILLSGGDDDRNGGSIAEIQTTVDLGVAFGSEKLLNLEMLLLEIAHRATEIEPLVLDAESISAESVQRVSEFDLLHCILDSEVKELEKLVDSIEVDIGNGGKMMASDEDPVSEVNSKLRDAAVSLNQMQDLISAIRRLSANFVNVLDPSQDNSGMLMLVWCY